jgi:hypothetical protein
MNLIARLNTHLSHSAHAWRDSMHLPWLSQDDSDTPSGSLVLAVALVSVAAALVMVTA